MTANASQIQMIGDHLAGLSQSCQFDGITATA